jgi:thioredoxin reductase (NADPH)
MGKGVSHCASCDAPLLRDRIVGVVGGGDSAAQEALTLAEFAQRVIILQRGEALTAQASFRDRITAEPKIELRCNTMVEEILGEAKVTGLRLRDRATGTGANLDLAGVFVYIGLRANTDFLAGKIAMDALGCVPTDNWMRTARQGLCAIGSVRSGSPGRAVISAGEGATAAIALDRYLDDGNWRGPPAQRTSELGLVTGAAHG